MLPATVPAPVRANRASAAAQQAEQVIQMVLRMLGEHRMDVVFVGQFSDGPRRFRVVETLSHGRAAAAATGQPHGEGPGTLLEMPVVLRDNRVHGMLCCFSTGAEPASTERDLRLLRHGARLIARLLDNEEVLRQLAEQSLSH
jgi:GAF domain-containing protein